MKTDEYRTIEEMTDDEYNELCSYVPDDFSVIEDFVYRDGKVFCPLDAAPVIFGDSYDDEDEYYDDEEEY